MSVFGTSVGQSVAGAGNAERIATREKAARPPERTAARRTRPDQPDEVVVNTESADAVRNLAGNNQEEAQEDRQEHPGYLPNGRSAGEGPHKKLDVQG